MPRKPHAKQKSFEIGDITVRHTLAGMAVFVAGAALIAGATTAHAMGTGNPYQDHQVGVSYVVYQPTTTSGLAQTDTGGPVCSDGSDENLVVTYGTRATTDLAIWEGNPICADPDGDGKRVAVAEPPPAAALAGSAVEPPRTPKGVEAGATSKDATSGAPPAEAGAVEAASPAAAAAVVAEPTAPVVAEESNAGAAAAANVVAAAAVAAAPEVEKAAAKAALVAEEKAKREAERAAEKARLEAERVEKAAAKAALVAEEKAKREAERAAEKVKREAERAATAAAKASKSEGSGGSAAAVMGASS